MVLYPRLVRPCPPLRREDPQPSGLRPCLDHDVEVQVELSSAGLIEMGSRSDPGEAVLRDGAIRLLRR